MTKGKYSKIKQAKEQARKDAIDGVLKDIDNDLIIWKNSPCVCCKNWRDTIIRFRNKQKDKIAKEMQE